jgi:hypothetical protein
LGKSGDFSNSLARFRIIESSSPVEHGYTILVSLCDQIIDPHQISTIISARQVRQPRLFMMIEALPNEDVTLILSPKQGDEESGRETETDTTESSGVGTCLKTEKGKDNISESAIDGGLGGWTCVVGGWFALFATFGWLNS